MNIRERHSRALEALCDIWRISSGEGGGDMDDIYRIASEHFKTEYAHATNELRALKAIAGKRKRRPIPPHIRRFVEERDAGGLCPWCNHPLSDDVVHFDHHIPLSKGGNDSEDNLRLMHARCNWEKGA